MEYNEGTHLKGQGYTWRRNDDPNLYSYLADNYREWVSVGLFVLSLYKITFLVFIGNITGNIFAFIKSSTLQCWIVTNMVLETAQGFWKPPKMFVKKPSTCLSSIGSLILVWFIQFREYSVTGIQNLWTIISHIYNADIYFGPRQEQQVVVAQWPNPCCRRMAWRLISGPIETAKWTVGDLSSI